MKLAVLGVGLVGGSIGLAARRRLDAEVVGFDPDPEVLARGLELGALDRACGSIAEAVAGASIAFCAAPVGALAELAREALAGSDEDCVISDVGSTKLELVAGLEAEPNAERFIGGHPLAGAETSGVENARADLFEGARWYLTPAARSSGVLYDRLQGTIADLGARPQAIDAGSHDRLMATVSHLPHVLANVLVDEAAEALAEESERMPDVGPSFRDTARVAGSNPAIWPDIFATNSEAVAAAIERVIVRLGEAVRVLREGERTELADWHGRARESRRSLLEVELVGGTLRELRVVVENRPGTVAEIALALGRAGVNIEDMGLYPAADMQSGAISLWIAGGDEAERAAEVVRGLGHAVTLVQAEA
jgi:prephenate dehydrogenase